MIAPIREPSAASQTPPRAEGVRRARKWIVRTLLTVHPAEPRPRGNARSAWSATAWIVFTAAAYACYLLLDLFN